MGRRPINAPNLITPRSKEQVRQTISVEEGGLFSEEGKNADLTMTHDIGMVLSQLYPDHLWGVRVSHKQGIIELKIPAFTTYSYVIHIANVQSPNALWHKIKEAGGQFLEIYGQPRGEFDPAAFQDTMGKLQKLRELNPEKIKL